MGNYEGIWRVVFIIFVAIFIGAILGDNVMHKNQNARLNALEAASTCAQQPQDQHLFNYGNDSGWVFNGSDTTVTCSNGKVRKLVYIYYYK